MTTNDTAPKTLVIDFTEKKTSAVPPRKIRVKLTGTNGNAFALLGTCLAAARKGKMDPETVKAFRAEAIKGDYDHLLCTCCDYFDVR